MPLLFLSRDGLSRICKSIGLGLCWSLLWSIYSLGFSSVLLFLNNWWERKRKLKEKHSAKKLVKSSKHWKIFISEKDQIFYCCLIIACWITKLHQLSSGCLSSLRRKGLALMPHGWSSVIQLELQLVHLSSTHYSKSSPAKHLQPQYFC